jgi:tetratricopeptide (TPR) repeat protein
MCRLVLCFCVTVAVATAQQPPGNDDLSLKAVDAERRGDFAGAVAVFQQLIQAGADSPELRSNLGIAYYQLHDFPQALHQFALVLAKTPNSVPANLFSGLALIKLERPKEALPHLKRAQTLHPDAPEITLALAQAQVAANEISQARDSYQRVTRLDPQNAEAWYGLGITARALAEQDLKKSTAAAKAESRTLMNASQQAIVRATGLQPDSVQAHMILGESFRIAELYGQAVKEYEAATAQQPNLAPAWTGLATAYSAAGDDDNALKAGKRALDLDPRDADTYAVIAATLLRQSDAAAAQPYALRALQIKPDLASAHIVLGKIYLSQHLPQKALPELESAVAQDTDGRTYYLLRRP